MEVRRKQNNLFDIGDSEDEEENLEFDFYSSASPASTTGFPESNDSGIRSGSPTLVRSISAASSLRKGRNGSSTSIILF